MSQTIAANVAPGRMITSTNLDGSISETWGIECSEEKLKALVKELFEEHWNEIVFGPCVQGAVFEGRMFAKPTFKYLDGYATVEIEGSEGWHFHLCLGPHKGTKNRPTPPELAAWRKCTRAAFFRDTDISGRPGSWGLRFWNGRDEQMMTVFFPGPWYDRDAGKFRKEPDWTQLDLWMALREKYAGVPAEGPLASAEAPRMH
ncbi:MAG: hypothetical protein AAB229_01070 [Candidatus Hydrogenedentota bacterium]